MTVEYIELAWANLRQEAEESSEREPFLRPLLNAEIIDKQSLASATSSVLAAKIFDTNISQIQLAELIQRHMEEDPEILSALCRDLYAYYERDSACTGILYPFLFYKGFHATQCYRIMHKLWQQASTGLAYWMQNRVSEKFGVDIHPAARIGDGLMIDHATGIVIGETSIVEDDVSIMQNVTLGGTGKETGDRHPIIRKGALISAGAKVLGRIEVGEGAKIGASSVVLENIPAHKTAVGVPARIVGAPRVKYPSHEMDHSIRKDMQSE